MKVQLKRYPAPYSSSLSVSLDDLHPETERDSEGLDFGSDPQLPPLSYLFEARAYLPKLAFTVFTVSNWVDRSDLPTGMFFPLRKIFRIRRKYKNDSFNINSLKFRSWTRNIRKLENFEVAWHADQHHQHMQQLPRSQEFRGLTKKEIAYKIGNIDNSFKIAKFPKTGFRPPGWFSSSVLLSTLKQFGISYIAATADMKSRVVASLRISRYAVRDVLAFYPQTLSNGLVNISANCFPHQAARAGEIAQIGGAVVVHAHLAKTEFGLISINHKFPKYISKMRQEILFRTGQEPWLVSLYQLAERHTAMKHVQITEKQNSVLFRNKSESQLNNLACIYKNRYLTFSLPKGKTKILQSPVVKVPKMSMVLTTFNGAETIIDSLNSLCHQTESEIEIIIVDDGSTDGTGAMISKYIKKTQENRIRYNYQQNAGRSSAKNLGLRLAKGQFVAFCEDDAWYSPEYISKVLRSFRRKDVTLVMGPHYVWNRKQSLITRAKELERRRNFWHYRPQSGWVYRTEQLRLIGGFNEMLEHGEDIEPAIRLKRRFPKSYIDFLPDAVWLHREPFTLPAILKRKYIGGQALAYLYKMKIKPPLVPEPLIAILLCLPFATLSVMLISPILFCILCTVAILLLLFFRRKALFLSLRLSNESLLVCVFAVMIEYVWWSATLLGYLKGLSIRISELNKDLQNVRSA